RRGSPPRMRRRRPRGGARTPLRARDREPCFGVEHERCRPALAAGRARPASCPATDPTSVRRPASTPGARVIRSRPVTHRVTIRDQFTRQAVPFSTAPGIKDEAALAALVELAGAGAGDVMLDVACGPGLVVAAFAAVVRHAIGIDVTPAMIARARDVAGEKGVRNVGWLVGDAPPLPFPDAAFSIVVCRFAFHH